MTTVSGISTSLFSKHNEQLLRMVSGSNEYTKWLFSTLPAAEKMYLLTKEAMESMQAVARLSKSIREYEWLFKQPNTPTYIPTRRSTVQYTHGAEISALKNGIAKLEERVKHLEARK